MNRSQHLIPVVASVLSMGVILWPPATAFGQEFPGAVARPATDAAVIPPPAGGPRAIVVQNSGTVSVIVLPAEAAGSTQSVAAPPYGPPLDEVFTPYSPTGGAMQWDMVPPSTSDVLTSNDRPLDTPFGPGADFSNNPWK